MKFYSLVIASMLFFNLAVGQDVSELDKRNGFKDIQLNTSVFDYTGLEYKKDIKDDLFPEVKVFVPVKGNYENIGSLKIYSLEVKTYRDSVFQIVVVTDKDPNLYKGLKTAFGEPEYHYRAGFYHWTTKRLRLSYTPYQKDKIEMKYESFLMRNKLKEDKKQEVEEIVSDF